jgi:hypothetical protein
MQNSENKQNKQTVKRLDKQALQNYNTVFTVLKSVNSSHRSLNPISLQLIKKIWSGQGSISTTDETIKWSIKIPSHIK